jgi:hypothetical protein
MPASVRWEAAAQLVWHTRPANSRTRVTPAPTGPSRRKAATANARPAQRTKTLQHRVPATWRTARACPDTACTPQNCMPRASPASTASSPPAAATPRACIAAGGLSRSQKAAQRVLATVNVLRSSVYLKILHKQNFKRNDINEAVTRVTQLPK